MWVTVECFPDDSTWNPVEDGSEFISEFIATADLEDEVLLVSNSRDPRIRKRLRRRLPSRVALPKYLQASFGFYSSPALLYYSSLLSLIGGGEMQITFRDLFTLRVVEAERDVIEETFGTSNEFDLEDEGCILHVKPGEPRNFSVELLASMSLLRFDLSQLTDTKNEVELLTLDNAEAQCIRLFQCKCEAFISNSICIVERHFYGCRFRDVSMRDHASMLPLVSQVYECC